MDIAALLNRYLSFAIKHTLVFVLGGAGIILLSIGLISLFISPSTEEDFVFTSSDLQQSATESGQKIYIDVSGAVVSPGLYELATDARIHDALVAAGGLSESADRAWVAKMVNLAAKVGDGSKLYIPFAGEGQQANILGSSNGLIQQANYGSVSGKQINLNTASISELDTLPGVGPATAQKIIDARPYTRIEELVEKKVVGQKTFDKLKELLMIY